MSDWALSAGINHRPNRRPPYRVFGRVQLSRDRSRSDLSHPGKHKCNPSARDLLAVLYTIDTNASASGRYLAELRVLATLLGSRVKTIHAFVEFQLGIDSLEIRCNSRASRVLHVSSQLVYCGAEEQ